MDKQAWIRRALPAALLSPLVSACADVPALPMPDGFPRIPAAASYGGVWAEGRFYTDHEDIFEEDLLEQGVVPVALRVFMSNEDGESSARVFVEDIRPELYLADGTRLSLIAYDRIKVDRDVEDRITEEALDINVVKGEGDSEEGFIFFQLPKGQFEVRDADLLAHLRHPMAQEVRISDSLLAIEYFTDEGARPIYVGLRKDRRTD